MELSVILYVSDQNTSKNFYQNFLDIKASIDVPGMTELSLFENCTLGLMPENSIAKIITPFMPHPSTGNGIPRCELYLLVVDCETYHQRAIQQQLPIIDDLKPRDWGHLVFYISDPDGHVIAIAEKL